uniref:Uncharacterized protein n=1 Tax=Ditylenchus dipsaci TaxID=166011 RepID=A0A915EQ17_9BILA
MTMIFSQIFTLILLHLTFLMIARAAYIDYSGAISGETDNMNAPQSGWLIRKFYNRSPPISAYDSNDREGNLVWMYTDNSNSRPELRGFNNLRTSLPSSDWLQAEKDLRKEQCLDWQTGNVQIREKVRIKKGCFATHNTFACIY